MTPVYLDTERAMAQIGDATALQELLTMLQSTLARDVVQIDHHLAAHDVASANRLLHALKGFIPIFCVDSLCTHVVQVETLSKTGSASDVAQAYAHLRPKLQQLQLEVGAHLGT